MNAQPYLDARRRSDAAQREVLRRTLEEREPLVIVASPPGAGKTYLVESVIAVAVHHLGLRVAVVAPRAEQTYDLMRRLVVNFDPMPITALMSAHRQLPDDLLQTQRILVCNDATALPGVAGVTIATADKLLFAVTKITQSFDLLICDEAYQLTFATLAPLFELAPSALLVGDPGQLPPLITVDTERFETARYRIHWPAPRELLRRFPQLDVVRLPASRRLPQDTVNLVQPAFYRQLPFSSAAAPAERRLQLDAATQGDTIDRALDMLADGATLVGVLLPPAEFGLEHVDDELAETMAAIAARLLARQPRWEGVRQLSAGDIGAIDAHVASGAAVRRSLRLYNVPTDACVVETPELWQGQERPLMVVKHTLSGQRQIDAFGLEPGRWCVMLSRHQIGCVIVGRDGVGDVLAEHRHDCGARPIGSVDAAWEGWRAHQAIWSQLEAQGRLLRIAQG
ncbi:ATP-binding protein [Candidatus Chloroploca sp. M-50]|uniref:ATP-binding protein n=1 Tax=Candidatus Chloroploca mongolica TaxID=2528176 RepID=A0ABS4D9X4_9CHLR|nr:AAA family ATPase [Candidatus Chloroploca mongolica]MBP1466227.1 ATP-binding protein [Candidatus Chloroploca mongolica]